MFVLDKREKGQEINLEHPIPRRSSEGQGTWEVWDSSHLGEERMRVSSPTCSLYLLLLPLSGKAVAAQIPHVHGG